MSHRHGVEAWNTLNARQLLCSAQCLVCNAKSNPDRDSSWTIGGAGKFSSISCSPGLRELLYNSPVMAQEQLSAGHIYLSSGEQGDRQSHPFNALGPRDDAGGQLKLSRMPDALNSPEKSLPCPSGSCCGGPGTEGHC